MGNEKDKPKDPAPKEITANVGSPYMVRWVLPADVQVTNSFVNADGTTAQDFPYPTPPLAKPKAEAKITLSVKKGETKDKLEGDDFLPNRTAPAARPGKATNKKGEPVAVNKFTAIFQAREAGVYLFTLAGMPDGTTLTEQVTVAAPTQKRYRTIEEVINDQTAFRRQAVLARVAANFPAFNTWKADPTHAAKGLTVGADTGVFDQGPWVTTFEFNGKGDGTSCTDVNGGLMTPSMLKTETTDGKSLEKKWAFDAGPEAAKGHNTWPNPGWVFCDKDHIPSVGDTYILLNLLKYGYGHVGTILHVPESGNGLWVCADGGQGTRPAQLALIMPKWGLMGAMLPDGGSPNNAYPGMTPDDAGGPWLAGAGDINPKAKVPDDGDVAAIINRIKFTPSPGGDVSKPSSPRRITGYVDVDSPKIVFPDLPKQRVQATIDACTLLKGKVDKVIAAYRKGMMLDGKISTT